jgi:hypothetical protein
LFFVAQAECEAWKGMERRKEKKEARGRLGRSFLSHFPFENAGKKVPEPF